MISGAVHRCEPKHFPERVSCGHRESAYGTEQKQCVISATKGAMTLNGKACLDRWETILRFECQCFVHGE